MNIRTLYENDFTLSGALSLDNRFIFLESSASYVIAIHTYVKIFFKIISATLLLIVLRFFIHHCRQQFRMRKRMLQKIIMKIQLHKFI
jgi:hypothetical protein